LNYHPSPWLVAYETNSKTILLLSNVSSIAALQETLYKKDVIGSCATNQGWAFLKATSQT
jgi:hypothetical protein